MFSYSYGIHDVAEWTDSGEHVRFGGSRHGTEARQLKHENSKKLIRILSTK